MGTLFIVITIVSWGLWGVFGKMALRYNSPQAVNFVVNLVYPSDRSCSGSGFERAGRA